MLFAQNITVLRLVKSIEVEPPNEMAEGNFFQLYLGNSDSNA